MYFYYSILNRFCQSEFFSKKLLTFCHAFYIIMVWQKGGEDLSPRTGRPKVDNPKTIRYSIRLDLETEEKLQAYSLENNITKGEAIRQGISLLLSQKK